MQKYFEILKNCILFRNIPEEYFNDALKYLRAFEKNFRRGEIIFNIGDDFNYSGIILEGSIECLFEDSDFNKFNMNHFRAGDMFGVTMAFAEIKESFMQIFALSDCVILFVDLRVLKTPANFNFQTQLSANLLQSFAKQNLFLNKKVRILSQKNLRRKILVYLRNLQPDKKGVREIPFSKTALAEFLCVNRTALSRELTKMIQEKILCMSGRKFVLI